MKIQMEQVEKLKEHADVTYEEAKDALERADGDILDAMILLEKEGKTKEKMSSHNTVAETHTSEKSENHQNAEQGTSTFGDQMHKLWQAFLRLLHKGNINNFEVFKENRSVLRIPVTILILALIFFFWITVPILIVFLFLGYKYRFSGPDLGKNNINNVMDNASETAENIKKSTMEANQKEEKDE